MWPTCTATRLAKSRLRISGSNVVLEQVLGRELLLHLADHICASYLAGDKEVAALVHSTRIHILPSMNPDGWKIATDHVRYRMLISTGK